MIREITRLQGFQGTLASRRLGVATLFAAMGIASVLACSSDDDTDTETEALAPGGPVVVNERDLPPAPAPAPAAPALGPSGSDTTNGLSLPKDMANWGVIGVVDVLPAADADADDKGTVRVIVGNETAVTAARAGEISPWPDGSMFGHLQWSGAANPSPAAATAVVPGNFAALTLMVKDSVRYADDEGWAFGVWASDTLNPLPAGFDRACVNCHSSNVPPEKDGVFNIIPTLPAEDLVASADAMPNDIELPPDILDWRVVSIASRQADADPTIRVVVGNDIAVEAARSGDTNPWPEGSELAHYVFGAGENPISANTVNPTSFSGFTLMVKDSEKFATAGGWGFGKWDGDNLTAPTAVGFDQVCIDCHTNNVSDNDFVFTIPGELPALLNP